MDRTVTFSWHVATTERGFLQQMLPGSIGNQQLPEPTGGVVKITIPVLKSMELLMK
jgi:hypothetical protein